MHVQTLHPLDASTRVTMTPERFQNLSAEEQRNIKSVYPALRHWEVEYYIPPPLCLPPTPKKTPGLTARLMLKILGYGSHHE